MYTTIKHLISRYFDSPNNPKTTRATTEKSRNSFTGRALKNPQAFQRLLSHIFAFSKKKKINK